MFPVLCAPRNTHTTELSSFSSQYLCVSGFISLFISLSGHTLQSQQKENDHFWGCWPVQAKPKAKPQLLWISKDFRQNFQPHGQSTSRRKHRPYGSRLQAHYPGNVQESQSRSRPPGDADGTLPCSFLKSTLTVALSPILRTRPNIFRNKTLTSLKASLLSSTGLELQPET